MTAPERAGGALHTAAFLLAALLLSAAAWLSVGARPLASTFVVTPPPALADVGRRDFTLAVSGQINHAPAAVELEDGRIVAIWFAGSREAAADVGLYQAIFDGTTWSAPVRITGGAATTAEEGQRAYTVGNPVVFRHPSGEYWLIYVTSIGDGWSASSLNLKRSADGIAWGPAKKLLTEPFLNLSTLVRSPPLIRADGLVALPAYHEVTAAIPELLLVDPAGDVVDRIRMGGNCLIQPALVPLGGGNALALFRQHSCADRSLYLGRTGDGGTTWSPPVASPFANPDSPAAALKLADGRVVAVLNNDLQDSRLLDVEVSADDGATWVRSGALFDGNEFNKSYRYPWMLQDREGRLHVLVSESQETIRHVIFGSALVTAR